MDEYGCYRNNDDDWKELAQNLKRSKTIVFPYSNGNGTCHIIHISSEFSKLGIMPFGGKPDGRFYVGVYGIGCNHFAAQGTNANYFEEKLMLPREDAEIFAEMWEGVTSYWQRITKEMK